MDSSFNIANYFKKGKTVVLTLRHGGEEEGEARQWSDKDTNLLMKQMQDLLPEFQNPRKRKKDVWEDVAKGQHNHGNPWSAEDCRKKWSNMIRTFRAIEEQRQDPEAKAKRIRWAFFEEMHQLLSLEGGDAFPEAGALSQLISLSTPPSSTAASGSSTNGSRSAAAKSSSLAFTPHNSQETAHASSSFLDTHQSPLQLGPAADMITLTSSDINAGLDIFSQEESIRFFKSQPQTSRSASPAVLAAASKNPSPSPTVPPKTRPLLKKKIKKRAKKAESSADASLTGLIEDMKKQNDAILDKIGNFHDRALNFMQERNELLRDIRDNLKGNDLQIIQEDVNESMEETEENDDDNNTLSLHIGPPFSTSQPRSNATVVSHLNNLVYSDSITTSSIPTFQLVQSGGVITNMTGSNGGNTVLANLRTFTTTTESGGIQEVLLQPVSVVEDGDTEESRPEINIVTGAGMPITKKEKR